MIRIGRRKPENLKLSIRKIFSKYTVSNKKKYNFTSQLFLNDNSIKLRVKKVKDVCPEGYRVMNLSNLQDHVSEITLHACQCVEAIALASAGIAPITLLTESRNLGLASVFAVQCKGCKRNFTLETSPRLPGSQRYYFELKFKALIPPPQ